MSRAWRHWWPLYALVSPLILAALAYAVVVGAHSWRWMDGCLTFIAGTKADERGVRSKLWGNPGGQCWSPIVGFSHETQRDRADLRVHEYTHVAQSMLGTLAGLAVFPPVLAALSWPLWLALCVAWLVFPICYGLGFVYGWLRTGDGFDAAYRANPLEVHAYAVQAAFVAKPSGKEWGA